VAQAAEQRESTAGQRPCFGPCFISLLYFTRGGVAIGEMVWVEIAETLAGMRASRTRRRGKGNICAGGACVLPAGKKY
jgi:hypothetical protein